MPISFVGSHVGTHAATSAQTVDFSNLRDTAGGTPTVQGGDFVLVAVNNAGTTNRTQASLTPSGYTTAHTDLYANDTNDTNLQVSYKVMGGTPDTSVAIPASDSTANGVAYAIYVFRNVDTSTPMDVTATTATGANTGVADGPSITPTTAGAWVVDVGAAGVAAGAVFTNPTGMSATTNHFRSATITTTTVDANIGVALKTDWSSGAFDPAAFGGSTSTNTGSWAAVTLALRPAINVGSAAGTGSVSGVGLSTVVGTGAASGTGTVSATSSSVALATGAAAGTTTISGTLVDNTRATTATRLNSQGVLVTDAANSVRKDYLINGAYSAGTSALLVEPAATNGITYSEDLTNAAWQKIGATITANAATGPDGNATMDKIVESTLNERHLALNSNPASISASKAVGSVFFKAAERGFGFISTRVVATGASYAIIVNLSTGTVDGTQTYASPTGVAYGVENWGGGIWRAWVSIDHDGAGAQIFFGPVSSAAPGWDQNQPTYTGDGSSGVYVWGAQVETGSVATSYIATAGSTVTRNADAVTMALPSAVTGLTFTFDDGSTQQVSATGGSTYNFPTNLNRPRITSITEVTAAAAAGAAAGTSTVSGVGRGTAASAGASAGTSAPTATGAATAASAASAAGTSTVTAGGAGIVSSAGVAAGTSTVTAVGRSFYAGVGAASGAGAATGTGAATAASAGSAAGTSTVSGAGASSSVVSGAGTAAGTSTCAAVGSSTAASAGSAAGVSTVAATATATGAGVGAGSGTGAASGVGVSTAAGAGSASSLGAAAGTGLAFGSGTGAAAGLATVAATGSSTAASSAAASGTGSATGAGAITAAGAGTAAGAATPLATGASTAAAAGASTGTSTTNAIADTGASQGNAAAVGSASGVGAVTAASPGAAAGSASATATATSTATGAGAALGVGTVAAVGVTLALGAGGASGVGSATGAGASTAAAAGSSAGVGAASGASSAGSITEGAGTATGLAGVTGSGAAVVAAAGAAAAAGSVSGVVTAVTGTVGLGAAAGTAGAQTQAIASGAGSAAGTSTPSGVGAFLSITTGTGLAVGLGSATAVGAWLGSLPSTPNMRRVVFVDSGPPRVLDVGTVVRRAVVGGPRG